MNFKILLLPETQTEVCLHRDCNDANEEIVRITTYVIDSTGTELMLESVAKFTDPGSAKSFVQDYSETSAKCFLQQYLKEEGIWIDCYQTLTTLITDRNAKPANSLV